MNFTSPPTGASSNMRHFLWKSKRLVPINWWLIGRHNVNNRIYSYALFSKRFGHRKTNFYICTK